jgi:hypothetical protein
LDVTTDTASETEVTPVGSSTDGDDEGVDDGEEAQDEGSARKKRKAGQAALSIVSNLVNSNDEVANWLEGQDEEEDDSDFDEVKVCALLCFLVEFVNLYFILFAIESSTFIQSRCLLQLRVLRPSGKALKLETMQNPTAEVTTKAIAMEALIRLSRQLRELVSAF